jgi:hypothetical protein
MNRKTTDKTTKKVIYEFDDDDNSTKEMTDWPFAKVEVSSRQDVSLKFISRVTVRNFSTNVGGPNTLTAIFEN